MFKLLLQTFLKKRSLFVAGMSYFVKSLRNVIGLASTKKSMIFYTCGIRDVVLRIFIQMAQCCKKRQQQSKKVFRTIALISFVLQMGGQIHGNVLTPLRVIELLVRLEMLQKKQLHPGWKEFRNYPKGTRHKISRIWASLVVFIRLCLTNDQLKKTKKPRVAKKSKQRSNTAFFVNPAGGKHRLASCHMEE